MHQGWRRWGAVGCAALTLAVGATVAGAPSASATAPGPPTLHWTQLQPSTSPPTRIAASLAYDPADRGLVLFGGQGLFTRFNDTWLWTGSDWKALSPAASPPPRQFAAMAYDPATKQLVLFSGEGCTGYCPDTWVWKGGTWTEEHPATTPVGRDFPVMAYDRKTKQLLMYGGQNPACGVGSAECTDTWSWNGTTWSEVEADGPPAGGTAVMAYDPRAGTVILYGGDNTSDTQTWAWTGTAWRQVASSGPCNTSYGSLARTADGYDILFGGYGGCPFQGTTEEWTGTTWTLLSTPTAPPSRSFAAMAYDPRTRQDILFSGETATSVEGPYGLPADTWSFGR